MSRTSRAKLPSRWLVWSGEPVLSMMQLKNLEEHKYNSHSASVLEPIMQPYWNWLVTKLPLWLAPNLITILGLAINIATSLIVVFYTPDGKHNVPGWACVACALGLFAYQSLDAIDGKQARRTGSSSPLGELFDHGCDSLSIVFVSLAACLVVGLGSFPWWMFFQCFAAFTLFYCAHWQAYVSGTVRFGKFDVTEAQFGIMLIHLVTSSLGTYFWSTELPLLGLQWKCAIELVISSITVYNFLFEYLFVILRGGCGRNGSTVAGTSVLSPAIPLILVLVPGYVVASNSQQHVFERHPALYIITFGLVAAKVTNKLVVAHMCKSELEYSDTVLIGPLLLLLNQYFGFPLSEYFVLWMCLIWTLWDLLTYCASVCLEICTFMDIQLFRITPKVASASQRAH